MDTQTRNIPDPSLYEVSPFFSDTINRNIVQSEVEGGVFFKDLRPGMALSIQTQTRVYELAIVSDNVALISGHPQICPEPVEVHLQLSLIHIWGPDLFSAPS